MLMPVQIAALSPEFSIGQKKEKLEQINGLVVAPLVASLAAEETLGSSPDRKNPGTYFIGGPESDKLDRTRLYGMLNESVKDVTKSKKIKEAESFDICEHKIDLLESSLKWRNIQKTLRWLNQILSSNHTNMKLCSRKKTHEPRAKFNLKTKNYDFYQSKTKKFKSFFKRKKPKRERKLMSDVKSSIRSRGERKIKRKRKHKHKSWKNISQNETKKLKSKWKEPRYEGKHLSDSNPTHLDATAILKPNSVLFDVERILMKKAKSRSVENHDCSKNAKSSLESHAVKMEKKCVESKNSRARLGFERKSVHPKEGWPGETEVRGYDPDSKLAKQKAWPHFVYHRVSSNFLHPEQAGHSRRQSAYVAISVATSSKPETTGNYASDNVG